MATKAKTRHTIHVKIVARDLPGLTCGVPEGMTYENIHVGIHMKQEVVELIAGNATDASWIFDVEVDGDSDFFGAHIQGKKATASSTCRGAPSTRSGRATHSPCSVAPS